MRIIKCRLNYMYCYKEEDKPAHAIKLNKRMATIEELKIKVPVWSADRESDERERWLSHPEMIITDQQMVGLMLAGEIPQSAEEVATFGEESSLMIAIEKATKKFEELTAKPTDHGDEHYNHVTDSPLSNVLLHSFNQVALLEDACSDQLQCTLNEGWRIIAVCPQPQRRPDYVLARVNPDFFAVDRNGRENGQLPSNAVRP